MLLVAEAQCSMAVVLGGVVVCVCVTCLRQIAVTGTFERENIFCKPLHSYPKQSYISRALQAMVAVSC